MGAGCCAVPAAAAIERTFLEWDAVERVEADVGHGRVTVTLSGSPQPTGADLVCSLRMLGLEATADEVVAEVNPF